jgi:elongation factor Ts
MASASISASMVKELREKTGVGMMECKKALEESQGDMEKAILWLRERGMSRAAKKADRVAAEGIVEVLVSPDHKSGALVELNCETDFASKNEEFRALAAEIAQVALAHKTESVDSLLAAQSGQDSIKNKLTGLIAKVGENMTLRRVKLVSVTQGVVSGYSHMGGKIGTLVALEGSADPAVAEIGKDLAMHVAAAAPRYLTGTEVSTDEIDQEKEIARKRLLEEGKAPDLIEKILVGQVQKFFKEICLLDQAFIKDPGLSVQKYVDSQKKGVKISGFGRYQLGEGIEKKKDDFAAEVAAAAGLKN